MIKLHIPIQILFNSADLNSWHIQEMGVCSYSNQTAPATSDGIAKRLETIFGRPALILLLNQRFFEQSATENHHPLCYWLITYYLVLKICPKFQVSTFIFLKLITCSINIMLKMCVKKFLTLIFVQCYNICWSNVWSQEFWCFLSGLDICTEQSENKIPEHK